jgi:alkylresorcinol/alkylpyrone synthase
MRNYPPAISTPSSPSAPPASQRQAWRPASPAEWDSAPTSPACRYSVSGLSIAARLAQARPGTNVLLVAVELCSLAVRLDELTKANVVATSLFGDGAAAVILRAGDGGATTIEHSGEHLWPDTLGIMGWNVDPEGFGVIFQRTIPDFVTEHLNPAVTRILEGMQLTRADIDRFICHPGGARVILALEAALTLHQGTLDHERQVIADCGNMSAPTVLFVLERARKAGLPPRSLLTALGPGFTASCVALRHAA